MTRGVDVAAGAAHPALPPVVTDEDLVETGYGACVTPPGEGFPTPDSWRNSMEVVDLFELLVTISEASDQYLC